jgi:hypothetical protein
LDRHLLIVANGFRYAGIFLGIPALVACLCLTGLWIELAMVAPKPIPSGSPAINLQRDGIVAVVVAGGTLVAKAFQFLTEASSWVIGSLSIVAFVLTLIGVAAFFTGRGLYGHATWARIVAGVIASGFFVVSFLAFTSIRRGPNFFALLPLSVSIYALWVLIRRFA